MVTTDWIKPTQFYFRTEIARNWGLTVAEVKALVAARVLIPVPLGENKRPVFLGASIIKAVERGLQPEK